MTGAQAIAGKLERERIRLMIAGAMSSTALTNPMMGCLVVWPGFERQYHADQ